MSFKNEPIAIVGSACRFPGGCNTPSKLWELLQNPRDLLQKIPQDRFNIESFYHPDPTHHGTTNVKSSYLLSEDVGQFDANFFNIPPKEAETIDPQQRMLMETVYDGLCAAGLPIEKLAGSSTAVYVGQMCDDWAQILQADVDETPTYTATGLARSIMANRISYFFDWHGPCMNIDTACSSSLVAVHEAVCVLRSGVSNVAVAAGANLLLGPGQYAIESNLRMLSSSGRCQMWDAAGDGYGRGEGIACVVLKTLSQAQRDGDHIECIIRETGVNQDGRTSGITMPSNVAQTSLIRETYRRAGLDLNNPMDRPQYFHAHGTGTKAGDPQEAEAIHRAFFTQQVLAKDKLLVGSIKTIIGHTEGTAGLASLIGTSLALQNGSIPPNMHFKNLNPDLVPFYGPLEVPTSLKQWPDLKPGQVRRASVNSFGFGGTNAHAIVEAYDPVETPVGQSPTLYTPLVFSANSSASLRTILSSHLEYLKDHPRTNMRDLAHTLESRRSCLPYRKAVTGSGYTAIKERIEDILSSEDARFDTRSPTVSQPRIMGVFTGQGAQWARMGATLLESSGFVRKRIAFLDESLASLPPADRPQWSISDELLAAGLSSRLGEAAISQPLCTAVQIVLVDLIQAAGIKLHAVVGHSSGEIGAAYAAGLISARDAIRVAYLRGIYAKLAASPTGAKGAMAAIGASPEDAQKLCEREELQGRVQVAAHNSSSSITLSGDEDAIDKAVDILKAERTFARRLRVDTAYHSAHMTPCAWPYLESMRRGDVKTTNGTRDKPVWFSSVYGGTAMTADRLSADYWVRNMVQPVLFSSAITAAVSQSQPFDLAIELGPHAALKGPALDSMGELTAQVPYTGLLSRGKDDLNELSTALGFIWTQLGSSSITLDTLDRLLNEDETPKKLMVDLPSYPFNHKHRYWAQTRRWRATRQLQALPHPLLGLPCVSTTTSTELQWKNILKPAEIPWIQGHTLQGQIVFPATGYIVMALEAIKSMVADGSITLFKLTDMVLTRAMVFASDSASVETLFSLNVHENTPEKISADFTCYSAPQGDASLASNVRGCIELQKGDSSADRLPLLSHDKYYNLYDVDPKAFYDNLAAVGYGYSAPFQGLSRIKRRLNFAHGTLIDQSASNWEDQLILHPGMLDTALQSVFAAFCAPSDNQLWSTYVPVRIESLEFNPHFVSPSTRKQVIVPWESTITDDGSSIGSGSIQLFTEDRQHTVVQMEGLGLQSLSPARPQDDNSLLSHFEYLPAVPDSKHATKGDEDAIVDMAPALDLERIAFHYLRRLSETSEKERRNALPHHQHLLRWADYVVTQVYAAKHPYVEKECVSDSWEQVVELIDRRRDLVEAMLIQVTGENLPSVIREKGNILNYMTKDELLGRYYREMPGLNRANLRLANLAKQISHRYPGMKILEIGAGTGGATQDVLPALGSAFSSYTFTDISTGFFEEAEQKFQQYEDRMDFKKFDMQRSPASQGFVEGSYDLVLASNVLHVATDLDNMMDNVRRLLKPGGYLVNLELMTNEMLSTGLIMGGLPGWWSGAETGRPHGPMLSLHDWDALLKRFQFGGIETCTPTNNPFFQMPVWVSQAIDDRVDLLRNPFTKSPAFPSELPSLIIIGGRSLSTYQLVEGISNSLSASFPSVIRLPSIETLTTTQIPANSTVLSLTELDEPLLKVVTGAKLDGLKVLWEQAHNILWVTKAARKAEPHSYMMFGIGRVIRCEKTEDINLQLLDIDCVEENTGLVIAETLLRHQLLHSWSKENSVNDLLWSTEPEIFIEQKEALLPRLYPSVMENLRANSGRRSIFMDVNPATASVRIVDAASSLQLEEMSHLRLASSKQSIRIRQSLLQYLKLDAVGSVMLCTGTKEEDPTATVLAITQKSESPAPIHALCSIDIPSSMEFGSLAILSVATHIVTQHILSLVPTHSTVVVHEPENAIRMSLSRAAEKGRINVQFTTCDDARQGDEWTFIHPRTPARLIKDKIHGEIAVFVNFESEDGPGARVAKEIAARVPPHGTRANAATFFTNKVYTHSRSDPSLLSDILQGAWKAVTETSLPLDPRVPIPLGKISAYTPTSESLQVIDWNIPSVSVRVRGTDNEQIFRRDRTYLLLGLAGEVGQSICHWMARCGAGNVVLASRNPKLDPAFVDTIEDAGATVRVLSLDMTSRRSFQRFLKDVTRSMPPIAGVANGALIAADVPFDGLTVQEMEKVMAPKVFGSTLLDEAFYDKPLDFFIMFSSIAACLGNPGQSSYAAANMFMTGLAFKRRERGVAGSVIDASALIGLGYISRQNAVDADYFKSIGVTCISESDLHTTFAEAVKSGKTGHTDRAEVTTGFRSLYTGDLIRDRQRNDLKYSHFKLDRPAHERSAVSKAAASVRDQLNEVTSLAQAKEILTASFKARVKKLLLTPADQDLDDNSTLVEQGIESLIAIDIRSWFERELSVDMPVVRILGGASIADLIQDCIGKLPANILDLNKISTDDTPSSPSQTVKPNVAPVGSPKRTHAEPEITVPEPTSASSTASSDSRSTRTPSIDRDSQSTDGSLSPDSMDSSWVEVVQSPKEITAPMSFGQSRFWFLHHAVKEKTAFNMALCFRLSGLVNVEDLSEAVRQVGDRHEALRTRYFWSGENQDVPTQGVLPHSSIQLKTRRISQKTEVDMELESMRNHVWNLDDWESMKLTLLSLSNTEHWLILGNHHITLDGFSIKVFLLDLEKAYKGMRLSELPTESQYRYFAEQQRQHHQMGRFQKHIEYFQTIIPQNMEPLGLFSFAKVSTRPSEPSYRTCRADIRLQPEDTVLIKRLARQNQSTNFHVYVAVLQVLLFRLLPDMDQVMIGIVDAGRTSEAAMETVGFLLNTLPVRLEKPDAESQFGHLIKTARNAVYGLLEHSAVPFDLLLNELKVDRSANASPVFQVVVDYRINNQERFPFANCRAKTEKSLNAATGFDVGLEVLDNQEGDTLLSFELQEGLYTQEHADLLVRSYVHLLKTFANKPATPMESIGTWGPEDISKALQLSTGPVMPAEWPETVVHRIDQMIQQHGHKPALKDGRGNRLTYNEMARRVDSIVEALLAAGTAQGTVVGVMQEPSADWICSMLAIFRVGATYLPLDLRNSIHRAKNALRVARPGVLLVDQATVGTAHTIDTIERIVIDISGVSTQSGAVVKRTENLASGDSPAVILFTSGSTGDPKGIVINFCNMISQLEAWSQQYGFSNGNTPTILQQSAYSFDMSLIQTFDALCNGGCLFVVPAELRGDPTETVKLIKNEQITYTMATPSEYQMWFDSGMDVLQTCSGWQFATLAGEQVVPRVVQEFRHLDLPDLRVWNLYGPSETSLACTWQGQIDYRNSDLTYPLHAGYAPPNEAIYIVDAHLKPVPVGVSGEVVVGGSGIAPGYVNMDSVTKEKFLPSPFAHLDSNFTTNNWLTVYRTGDRGFLQSDGSLCLTGRIDGDTQVKLRGIRIEMTEIENALIKAADGVLAHAVVTTREQDDEKLLVAHVVFSTQHLSIDRQVFLDNLRSKLPIADYMIPSVILPLETLPLNAHFKADRSAIRKLPLETPNGVHNNHHTDRAMEPFEASLAELWRRVLPVSGQQSITPETNFFHVGGSSLVIVKLQRLIKNRFQAAPRVNELVNARRLADMAALIEGNISSRIDWEAETAVPESWTAQFSGAQRKARPSDNDLRILLTGVTGYLGRNTLPSLIRSRNVSQIYCLVRPGTDTSALTASSNKISVVAGDLSLPNIGLSSIVFDGLSADIDAIVHCGANRSFWDDYEVLRGDNVTSVKELARLALPRHVPLHLLSSGATRIFDDRVARGFYESDHVDVAGTPPDNGSDGYVASKWAAEHFLTNVSQKLSLPVFLHRFSPVPGLAPDSRLSVPETDELLNELVDIATRLGVRPAMNEVDGWADLLSTAIAVQNICSAVLSEQKDDHSTLKVLSHTADTRVNWGRFKQQLEVNDQLNRLPIMPTLQWMGEAKKAGLSYILASHRLVFNGESGSIVSRR